MRKDYFLTLLCLFLMALAQTVHADVNKIYGVTSLNEMYPDRAPSFVYGDNGFDYTTIAPVDSSDPAVFMASGANCNGTYYGLLAKEGAALKFVTVDWATGTTTDVATADASCPLLIDMAYNFNTKKLYGIAAAAEGGTDIYEVAAAEGKATKVKNVAEELKSFDFSFDGKMHTFYIKKHDTPYGENNVLFVKSYDENLDNPTQETLIQGGYDSFILIWGSTINVEFDHMTNTLYYAECGNSQQYANGIDITTWKQTGNAIMLGSNYPDITALYIPFTAPEGGSETPTAVTELKATADQTGAAKATLTWVNPTTNFVGGNLTALNSIKIYRNSVSAENLLAEITNDVTPGATMTWTDENAAMGENKYVIVPCRVAGENGISAEVTVWVGYDTPGAVANIKLEKVEGGINVSWEKPATTVNGGVLDLTTLKYKVVRQPDNVIVAENITETTVLDKNALPSWQKYSYQITATTAAGSSEATDGFTNIFAGPDLTPPYEFAFNDYDIYDNMWTAIGDEMGVGYLDSYNYNCWALMLPGWGAADYGMRNNFLISPEIKLTSGKYTISVGSWIEKANDANCFTLYYGKGKTADDFTNNPIQDFMFQATADGQKDMATATFDIAEDGFYNFAINVTAPIINPDGYGNVGINFFKIEETKAEQFKVTGKVVNAAEEPIAGASITLHNDGNKFTATSAEDGTFTIDVEGNKGECIIVVKKEGYQDRRIYTDYTGTDINLDMIVLDVTPETFFVKGKVVDEEGNGIAEALVIVGMGDDFNPTMTEADGTFNLEMYGLQGEYTITIEKDGFVTYTDKLKYEGTDIELGEIVMTTPAEKFKVTGTLVNSAQEPIENASITVHNNGNKFTATSTADGTFTVEVEGQKGECIIIIDKEGYKSRRIYEDYTGTDIDLDIILLDRAPESFFVKGKVVDSQGQPIAEATVIMGMDGDFNPTITAADGTFNLEMYGMRGEYSISVEKDGYVPYTDKFTFEGTDVNLNDIVLLSTTGIGGIVYDADGNADIRVYDMSGRLIKAGKVTRNEGLGLSKGVYIINGKKTVVK